jgi:hypothetical protein
MSEWQPIETAPKDGSEFIGYHPNPNPHRGRILTMAYDRNRSLFAASVPSFIVFEPSHWMPLPKPPGEA